MERRRRWRIVVYAVMVTLFGALVYVVAHLDPRTAVQRLKLSLSSASERLKAPEAANSTLGFGTIYIVSSTGTKQREGLREAARLSDVDIEFLERKQPKSSEVKALRKGQGSEMSDDGAMAWLQHTNALQRFLNSGLDTALLIGGNVDWTADLRISQIPVAATTVQRITTDQVGFLSQIMDQPELRGYWGVWDSWDVLNLGDCGEYSTDPNWKANVPHLVLPDQSMSRRREAGVHRRPATSDAHHPRLVSRASSPLCASGYAVTRRSAERLLDQLANPDKTSAAPTYDERMSELCRESVLRCLSISPRLLHRIEA